MLTSRWAGTPPWLTGQLERFFFTIAVAMDASGVMPAMIAWLGLKLVANWQLRHDIGQSDSEGRSGGDLVSANYRYSAVVAGLLSMLFTLVGGQVIRALR
jgi:hypothetical protein